MKKKTILWLIGILALLLHSLILVLIYVTSGNLWIAAGTVYFLSGILPLVYVTVLCPLIYLHGVKTWEKRKIYPPFFVTSWGVNLAFQVCLVLLNLFILIWGIMWFVSTFFPNTEIIRLIELNSVLISIFMHALCFFAVGKLFLAIFKDSDKGGTGMSPSA